MIKTVLLRCDRFKMETKYKMKVDERKQAESNRWQFNKKKKIKEKKNDLDERNEQKMCTMLTRMALKQEKQWTPEKMKEISSSKSPQKQTTLNILKCFPVEKIYLSMFPYFLSHLFLLSCKFCIKENYFHKYRIDG